MALSKGEFESLLIEELPKLRSFAFAFTHDRDQADDLFQEAVLKMVKYRDNFQEGTVFGAWAFTVMRNTHRDKNRSDRLSKRDVRKTDHFEALESLSHLFRIDGRQQNDVIDFRRAFMKLSRRQRDLLMKAGLGFSYEELAGELNISVGTVKSRISRARNNLLNPGDN